MVEQMYLAYGYKLYGIISVLNPMAPLLFSAGKRDPQDCFLCHKTNETSKIINDKNQQRKTAFGQMVIFLAT